MTLATKYYAGKLVVALTLAQIPSLHKVAASESLNPPVPDFRAEVRQTFWQELKRYQNTPNNVEASWHFGRACFDMAEFATNKTERADISKQGIAACEQAVSRDASSAAAQYYLGMNLAQSARTKSLGALRIVRQMETVFARVRELDESFDYAGADRNLGLLYRDAPSFGSIGDRTKAREHLQRAVQLAPNYPENRLNLIESHIKWNELDDAKAQLKALEALLPQVRSNLTGRAWTSSWVDWESRLKKVQRKL